MNRFFYISNKYVNKIAIILFASWFFSLSTLSILILIFSLIYFYLFRRKNIDILDKRILESNVMVSPFTATYLEEQIDGDIKRLVFKIKFWDNYGIFMPINGDITDYSEKKGFKVFHNFLKFNSYEIQTIFRTSDKNEVKIKFINLTDVRRARIYTRSGDRGRMGANIGYLPFGGKVVIELPLNAKVLVKKGDKVLSFQTLLANFEELNGYSK